MRGRLTAVCLFFLASVSAAGCSSASNWVADLLRPRPQPLPPASDLYDLGNKKIAERRYEEARQAFRKIVERHPESTYAARARFLVGEAYYREGEFDKAIAEFEAFIAFFPRHQIADLVQYRLAMAYYDQLKPVEQDQGITKKAEEQFRKLVRDYPDSRYASDALAKIDICRGRLAQKELWVAAWYLDRGNPGAARQRLEALLRDYARTLVIPEALFRLGEIYAGEGLTKESQATFRRLAEEYGHTEWGRRAAQRLRTAAR
jgi:outer membrane protein assembly factor BamD